MKISIKCKFSDKVLFEGEYESIKHAVIEAVKRRADLTGADLWDADLRDADLTGADLRDANLRDADLRDADLRRADLTGADLTGADLWGKKQKIAPLQLIGLKYFIMTDGNTVKISCQIHTWDKWLSFSDSEISEMDINALDWWNSHKDLIAALVKQHNELEKA